MCLALGFASHISLLPKPPVQPPGWASLSLGLREGGGFTFGFISYMPPTSPPTMEVLEFLVPARSNCYMAIFCIAQFVNNASIAPIISHIFFSIWPNFSKMIWQLSKLSSSKHHFSAPTGRMGSNDGSFDL